MGQDHHAVRYDQASLSFFCWEQIWWPSPHRYALILLRYRLSQTKKCRSPYSKSSSYSSPAFTRLLSLRSTIRLHTEEHSRVTYFVIHFFRLGSSFLLVNTFFARVILDLIFFSQDPEDREFLTSPLTDFHHLSLHNISLHTILVV